MIEAAVTGRLANFAGLAALVGDRIYLVAAPLDAPLPHVVYTPQAPIDSAVDLDGPGTETNTRVQVDAWALTADEAIAVGDQVRLALRGFTGTAGGVPVDDINIAGGFDDSTPPTGSDPNRYFRRSTDFLVTTTQQES